MDEMLDIIDKPRSSSNFIEEYHNLKNSNKSKIISDSI